MEKGIIYRCNFNYFEGNSVPLKGREVIPTFFREPVPDLVTILSLQKDRKIGKHSSCLVRVVNMIQGCNLATKGIIVNREEKRPVPVHLDLDSKDDLVQRKESNVRAKFLGEVQIKNAQDWGCGMLGKELSLSNATQLESSKGGRSGAPVLPVGMEGDKL